MTSPERRVGLRAARALESASGLDGAVEALLRVDEPFLARFPRLAALLRGEQLGHAAHPLLTDLPIGLWSAAVALDLVGGRRAQPAADRLVGLGVAAFVPTAAAGWADWSVGTRAIQRVGVVHAALNGATVLLFGASWALRRGGRRGAGVAVSLAATLVLTASGYLGGHMVYRLGAPTGGPVDDERRPQPRDVGPAAPTVRL